MWNINIRSGAIWSVKSYNESDDNYIGMSNGTQNVLILGAYTECHTGIKKFTFLKLTPYNKHNKFYYEFLANKQDLRKNEQNLSIDMEYIYTGDQRALKSYIDTIDEDTMIAIKEALMQQFNLIVKTSKPHKCTHHKASNMRKRQQIRKFNMDIYVIASDAVKITKSNKLVLSSEAKDDIVFNALTEEDFTNLSEKYQIFPVKAIKQIRNRLVYQYKQKENQ